MSIFPCFLQTCREEPFIWKVLVFPCSKAEHRGIYKDLDRAEQRAVPVWNLQRLCLGTGKEKGVLTRKSKLEMPINILPFSLLLFLCCQWLPVPPRNSSHLPTGQWPTCCFGGGVDSGGISANQITRQSLDRDSDLLMPDLLQLSLDGNNLDLLTPTSQQKISDVGKGPPLLWQAPANSVKASGAMVGGTIWGLSHLGHLRGSCPRHTL